MSDSPLWVNSLSSRASLEGAIAELMTGMPTELVKGADLGLVFISGAYASEYSRVMPLLREHLRVRALIGCSGGGIVGTGVNGSAREIEQEPAISLTLAKLPGVEVKAFYLDGENLPDLDGSPNDWVNLVGVNPQEEPDFVILADPFSSRINDLLQGLDFAYPRAAKVGGLVSGGEAGFRNGLFCNYELYREGVVGVALSGNVRLEPIVAQGCRPVGDLYQVVKGERNVIVELAKAEQTSQPLVPVEALRELLDGLTPGDRALAEHSLFIGLARDEFKLELEAGDFLIRNMIGVDPRLGAIAIGDRVRPGQRLQFHLRDAQTSAQDLEIMLKKSQEVRREAIGALMFTCLGRGERLYGQPNFDSQMFQRLIAQIPVSGFFCNGEIGPVGGQTFLHGYTSVFGIVSVPDRD